MLQKIVFACVFAVASMSATASHVVGGDLFVEWVSMNTYKVGAHIYRDCDGFLDLPDPLTVGVYEIGTNNLVQTVIITSPINNQNIPLEDSCYVPQGLCIDEGIYLSSDFTLPDYGPGYYLSTEIYARNSIIDNISNPGSTGMTFYMEIPDPALGQNSSPNFGDYPEGAYFCTNYPRQYNFNVIDADGDSLVYSLVNPLQSITTGTNSTEPGSGAYPYYPEVTWAGGYSLADIIGGANPMSIDTVTGTIFAHPAMQGVFVYAVKVEEFRNGVKIGEVRRDVQYSSFNCYVPPPSSTTADITVDVADTICFDVIVTTTNVWDSLYVDISCNDLDLADMFVEANDYYTDFHGNDTFYVDLVDTNGSYVSFVGDAGMRYCLVPECDDIDSTYYIALATYSVGCTASEVVYDTMSVTIFHDPQPTVVDLPETLTLTFGEETCLDMYSEDLNNPWDTLFLGITSATFDHQESFVAPQTNTVNGETMNYYLDFAIDTVVHDTLFFNSFGLEYPYVLASEKIGVRYCWTTDCDDVFIEDYEIILSSFSGTKCGRTDPVGDTTFVHVDPPVGVVLPVPNVFTPNGDGVNDVFRLAGTNDPCYDVMTVEIYNRWGRKLFESNDPLFEWDGTHNGKACDEGTYFILMDGTFGSTYDPSTGLRVPNVVTSQYTFQILR